MIEAVAFDLDGVVRRWPSRDAHAIEARAGIPAGTIATIAFGSRSLPRALVGTVPDAAWRGDVARRLERCHGPAGLVAATAWSRLRGRTDPKALELVRETRRSIPVALLTNATTRLSEDLAALQLAREFDVIVSSADVGSAKPDPAIFRRALEILGVAAGACVIVDDDPMNVAAARRLGMIAIRYRGPAEARRRLARLGVAVTDGGRTGA